MSEYVSGTIRSGAVLEFDMDAFWSFVSGIPWYAWVAIVVILAGVVVVKGKKSQRT